MFEEQVLDGFTTDFYNYKWNLFIDEFISNIPFYFPAKASEDIWLELIRYRIHISNNMHWRILLISLKLKFLFYLFSLSKNIVTIIESRTATKSVRSTRLQCRPKAIVEGENPRCLLLLSYALFLFRFVTKWFLRG